VQVSLTLEPLGLRPEWCPFVGDQQRYLNKAMARPIVAADLVTKKVIHDEPRAMATAQLYVTCLEAIAEKAAQGKLVLPLKDELLDDEVPPW
jgi:hypothetical protein